MFSKSRELLKRHSEREQDHYTYELSPNSLEEENYNLHSIEED